MRDAPCRLPPGATDLLGDMTVPAEQPATALTIAGSDSGGGAGFKPT